MDSIQWESSTTSEHNLPAQGATHADDDEQQESWFEPAETVTDLQTLLESLDSQGPEDLSFQQLDVTDYQTNIASLRTELEGGTSALTYLDEFEQVVKNELLYIGSIPYDRFQTAEQKLQEDHVNDKMLQASTQQQKIEKLMKLTELAKERVWMEMKQQQKATLLREQIIQKREKLQYDQMQKAFRQSENQLRHSLEERKAEVKAFYGDLTFADNQYGGSKARRWRVEWSKTPQPVQVKVNCIRGIRDKAPAGRYVMVVSLYDRLGGHVLRWAQLAGQQWGGATLPVFHDGKFSSSEISIEQSVFTVLPPQWRVQPGMILAFELFLLRGSISPIDRVVAWGCFPICDGQFRIVQGFYKLPLIRGHMDHRITKHSTFEHLIATDIDHWIANLYIQITRLPRYLSGQKEYEVELQFTSGLLSFPDRIENAEEAVDGEKMPSHDDGDKLSLADDSRSTSNMSVALPSKTSDSPSTSGVMTSGKEAFSDTESSVVRHRKARSAKLVKSTVDVSRKDKKSKADDELESDCDEDLIPVQGERGVFYKIHYKNPVENYNAKRTATLLPKTPLLNKRVQKPKLTHLEDLERHTFSVQPPFSTKGRMQRIGYERAEYVGRMFLSEMGFSQWRTREFWITILLLILLWFVRLYVHYSGQWLFLQALRLPVSSFIFFPYTVNLNYQDDLLSTGEEIGVVVLGPISNIIIQIVMVLISWFSQIALGTFPLIFSKFIMAFSIWVVFDPYMILIVDAALGRYVRTATQPIGDAFKLYWHFYDVEGSGVVGIPLIIFLYLVITFIAVVILYLYFLKLHNNGRMLDVFFRLHGDEDCFFIPHDLELSNQELSYIVKKAEQWRGADGERRKVSVYDYIWDEESDDMEGNSKSEVTTHISIHTLHLDGLRELYRHFLRLTDGAIVEVFGELGSANLLPDVKTALLKRANNIENVFGSSVSLDRSRASPLTTPPESRRMNNLLLPTEHRDRPLTGDSMKTRETIRRESSSESSDDNQAPYIFPDNIGQSSEA